MSTISDITRQRKRTERYSVFIDGAYRFSLSDLELSTSGLAIGQELTPAEVEQWEEDSEISKALARTYDLLARRPRSRQELERYLSQKGYDPSVSERVLVRLSQNGLVDDEAFAGQWVDERIRSRSRHQLIQELRQKGVDPVVVEAVLAEVAPDDEYAAVKRLIEKRLRGSRLNDRQATIRYLSTKGFSYDLVKRVLEQDFSDLR